MVIINFGYSQCEDLLESGCDQSSSCEWNIIETENYSCTDFGNQSSCENYSDYGCSWEFSWGGWQNYGSSCVGGSFTVASGFCEQIQVSECIEMDQIQCSQSNECDWVISGTESVSCTSLDTYIDCSNVDDCNWTSYQQACSGTAYSDCVSQPGCSYSWLTYSCTGTTTVTYCGGGNYEVPTYSCVESIELECDIMNEVECSNDVSCEWVENISYGNCSSLAWQICNNYPGCYVDSEPGWYDSSGPYCTGGTYQVDNSYCEEGNYIPGDANGDGIINIADIVAIVDLILNAEYDESSDINNDYMLNINDIIELVNIIIDI